MGADGARADGRRRRRSCRACTRSARRWSRASSDVAWPCNETKYISHFPETREIWCYGSGYGGNSLLGKKCYSLRIASVDGPRRGLARRAHADPQADLARAARSTTSPRRSRPPAARPTWRCSSRPSPAGRSRRSATTSPGCASATTAGSTRSTPSTGSSASRPARTGRPTPTRCARSTEGNSLFTNVALTDDGDIWWEGMGEPPAHLTDWKGSDWTPDSGELVSATRTRGSARRSRSARSSRRSTTTRTACRSPRSSSAAAARRPIPLVTEARDWVHGVYLGATLSSETTAAAAGEVGVVRRDPMAMLPFIGYNAGDYFRHWIEMGKGGDGDAGKLPEDLLRELVPPRRRRPVPVARVRRELAASSSGSSSGSRARADAVETPIGHVPAADALDIAGPGPRPEPTSRRRCGSTPRSGRPRSRRSPSGSRSSATSCPASCGPNSTRSRPASAWSDPGSITPKRPAAHSPAGGADACRVDRRHHGQLTRSRAKSREPTTADGAACRHRSRKLLDLARTNGKSFRILAKSPPAAARAGRSTDDRLSLDHVRRAHRDHGSAAAALVGFAVVLAARRPPRAGHRPAQLHLPHRPRRPGRSRRSCTAPRRPPRRSATPSR